MSWGCTSLDGRWGVGRGMDRRCVLSKSLPQFPRKWLTVTWVWHRQGSLPDSVPPTFGSLG